MTMTSTFALFKYIAVLIPAGPHPITTTFFILYA